MSVCVAFGPADNLCTNPRVNDGSGKDQTSTRRRSTLVALAAVGVDGGGVVWVVLTSFCWVFVSHTHIHACDAIRSAISVVYFCNKTNRGMNFKSM